MGKRYVTLCKFCERKFFGLWQSFVIFTSLASILIIILLAGLITIRCSITLQNYPEPQAILILDGEESRIRQAATFAQQYPDLPIWISGYCSNRLMVQTAFEEAQVRDRVHYDLRATDTVTHFTSLVDNFIGQDIHHVYIVTSDYHMTRARAIAMLIFGSNGVVIAPVSQISRHQPPEESWLKVLRDGGRALIWLVSGHSGARFNGRHADNCRL